MEHNKDQNINGMTDNERSNHETAVESAKSIGVLSGPPLSYFISGWDKHRNQSLSELTEAKAEIDDLRIKLAAAEAACETLRGGEIFYTPDQVREMLGECWEACYAFLKWTYYGQYKPGNDPAVIPPDKQTTINNLIESK